MAPPVPSVAPLIEARGVVKRYASEAGEVEALRGVDLTVAAGEYVAVMGPSGSGKTTLLNCLSGLDDIDAGRVIVDGVAVHEISDRERTDRRAASTGFVFQAFNLIPVFSALENVELPLLLQGVDDAEARQRASDTLTRVGLAHRLHHRPNQLSGGEQQRVTIARALAGRPRLVWADEPTGNLDSETAGAIMTMLDELRDAGVTVILVTHDLTVADHADRLIVMRDGNIASDSGLRIERRDALATARA